MLSELIKVFIYFPHRELHSILPFVRGHRETQQIVADPLILSQRIIKSEILNVYWHGDKGGVEFHTY